MCLILFALDRHPRYRLIVAANRDEWFERPAAPAAFWDSVPGLLAGRDLVQGGTWMGVTTSGRFAAITNFRDPASQRDGAPSRGDLTRRYLAGDASPGAFLAQARSEGDHYNGFNLLVGDRDNLFYYSNRGAEPRALRPGTYGLSNHLLDTSWPKITLGKARLDQVIDAGSEPEVDQFFELLGDRTVSPDAALPATGVSLERERALSPAHIIHAGYGTRCATVLLVGRHGDVHFSERTFDHSGAIVGVMSETFVLDR